MELQGQQPWNRDRNEDLGWNRGHQRLPAVHGRNRRARAVLHQLRRGHGVDPDILLDNDPVKEYAGEDQQLNKAIETALQQIKDRKPLPETPAPRTFKDLGLPEIK